MCYLFSKPKKHKSERLLITATKGRLGQQPRLWYSSSQGQKAQKFQNMLRNDWNDVPKKTERRVEKGGRFNHNAGEKTRDTSWLGRASGRGTGNIARIINHTQVTIINDIQHNGSNVGKKRRRNEKRRKRRRIRSQQEEWQQRKFVLNLNFDSSWKASFMSMKNGEQIFSNLYSLHVVFLHL